MRGSSEAERLSTIIKRISPPVDHLHHPRTATRATARQQEACTCRAAQRDSHDGSSGGTRPLSCPYLLAVLAHHHRIAVLPDRSSRCLPRCKRCATHWGSADDPKPALTKVGKQHHKRAVGCAAEADAPLGGHWGVQPPQQQSNAQAVPVVDHPACSASLCSGCWAAPQRPCAGWRCSCTALRCLVSCDWLLHCPAAPCWYPPPASQAQHAACSRGRTWHSWTMILSSRLVSSVTLRAVHSTVCPHSSSASFITYPARNSTRGRRLTAPPACGARPQTPGRNQSYHDAASLGAWWGQQAPDSTCPALLPSCLGAAWGLPGGCLEAAGPRAAALPDAGMPPATAGAPQQHLDPVNARQGVLASHSTDDGAV
jgi:hypothetical protein